MKDELIKNFLKVSTGDEMKDEIWWKIDGEEARFFILCNDVFAWAVSDCEEIKDQEDIDLYEKCLKIDDIYGGMLYCSKKRGVRPQDAVFNKLIPAELWATFDECGPERKNNHGNPVERKCPNEEKEENQRNH